MDAVIEQSQVTITDLDGELLRRDFHAFVVSAWDKVEKGTIFQDGWHIRMLCDYLQALYDGRIPSNSLMANVPPRHMKSLLCNVFFPAWVWTKTPAAKFLCFSYSEALTLRDSIKCRDLIASRWYEERFHIVINKRQDSKDNFQNTFGGYRMCFGTGGSIAGQGGDYLIIDDPLEISKANSKAEREHVNYVYDNAIAGRGNDPKTVKKILIMQRLHDEDLCGHIIERGDPWELLILPAEWEGVRRFTSSIGLSDPRTEVNELLWPEHIGRKELDILKLPLSEIGVAGQFQQRPTPLVGAIFKRNWFTTRRESMPCVGRYFSWDTAASIEDTAAYTCGIVGELTPDYKLYIRDVWRKKIEFPQLQYAIEEQAKKYGGMKSLVMRDIIIENKSSGIQVIQSMKQISPFAERVMPYTPKGDKIARAYEAAKWCEKGCVVLPPPSDDSNWMIDFETELFNFPNAAFKDQVDALSQLCDYLSYYLAEGLQARATGRKITT
jgi:predicted phage terminase large subunit-like protein